MRSPRWRKLARDVARQKGRAALMVVAIAVSVIAIGAVLGAFAILGREIAVNYLGTRPASATLELPGGVDAAVVEEARRHPAIAEAEARDVVVARARVGDDWRPLLLFVVDDFDDLRLNTFRPEAGAAWPPPAGTMLIERTAVPMLEAGPGARVLVKSPHGDPREVAITGLVHDPGLAPAWQERQGYGYVTRETLASLGEAPVLHELRIEVRDRTLDAAGIEAVAAELARSLAARGHEVHELRVPPPREHPHQRQMTSVLFLMLAFSVMALLLSAILVATSLAATLARQVREIGVMKTVGARTGQLARLYAVLVAALGLVAAALALPAGIFGARAFARSVAAMLNFTLTSVELPLWVFAVQVAAGVIVPLLVAAIPIARAARITVREAIDQQGAPPPRPRSSSLPLAVRNALRRPARLLLTMTLLSAGGAMFMTALDVSRGWERNLDKMRETRFYDVEVKLEEAEPHAVAAGVRALPGVRIVESWGHSPAAIARPGRIDVVRTYPDRGHGSLAVLAPPPESALVRFPVLSGRWLVRGDDDAVVLNHVAARQAAAAGVTVGGRISLSLDGIPTTWRVVGIVEEIGAAGVAYVTDEAFARVTGTSGRARLLRIATGAASPAERTRVIRAIDRSLLDARVGVEAAVPLSELRTAVGDHIVILIRALIAMAIGMAVVGTLGLGSTMSISIVERTRELGVMKAIGATPARIVRAIIGEGLAIALASCVLAILLGIPLTALVGWLVGNLGFLAPLPLVIAPGPMLLWTGLVTLVAVAATWWPARRAAALRVTDALAYT